MTDHDDRELDESINDAWSDVKVTPELKASTMAAIRAARDADAAATEVPEDAEGKAADDAKAEALDDEETNAIHGAMMETAVSAATASTPVTVIDGGRKASRTVRTQRRRRLVAGLVAAVLVLSLVGVGGNAVYHTETAYASVTAQTTVTIGINRFGRVITATAAQTDMQDEIDSLGLIGMDYEPAMNALIESGYLGGTDVDAEVSSDAADQQETLVETTTACLGDAGCSGTCNGNQYGRRAGAGQSTSDDGTDETSSSANGQGMGSGNGMGSGSGNGMGSGSGSGSGNGNGSGSGNGSGNCD